MSKRIIIILFPVINAVMCSLQSASDAYFGTYPSEQLEDDFITNLFSQNITSNNDFQSSEATLIQNVLPSDSSWRLADQMDHDYIATESSTLLSPSWEEGSSSTLSMSTYFSTFDPSAQIETKQQHPVMQNNIIQAMGKIHRAPINLVPTATGILKTKVKRNKRKRTVFKTDQVEALEKVFATKPYVTKEDRQVLVEKLNISDKSIKIWFQNRRLKNRRDEDDENSTPSFDRLDYVESKINERTNALGYVTLDDGIMRDLVQVVEEYLIKAKTDCEDAKEDIQMEVAGVSMQKAKVYVESIPVYEPISPASTTDCSYDSSWECQSPGPNEYLQTLIDIDSIISK